MKKIKIGLIGAGFMGNAHAIAFSNVPNVFGEDIVPEFEIVADINEENAKNLCRKFGFKKWTTDWREVVRDPEVELVDITTPNSSHVEIAIAAAKENKHIYCEKPLAMDAEEAKSAADVVEEKDIITVVGFNYLQNPVQAYAKHLIETGELGEITSFRGTFDQDYYADPNAPHAWRFLRKASSSGALGDLASHTISLSQYLIGDVEEVCGLSNIVYNQRPDPNDENKMKPVENDDVIHFIFRYKNGALGTIASSRVGTGRKLALSYEIQGTKGSLLYTQERMNELKLYRHTDPETEQGFKTILAGPKHPNYKYFYGGAGIGLGYGDQKTIEAHMMLDAVANNKKSDIDFNFGWKVNKMIDAVLQSNEEHGWVKVY